MAVADTGDPTSLRSRIVTDLELRAFPMRGYRHEAYLRAVMDAGYEPSALARAHDVTERTIYNALAEHGLTGEQQPTRGPAQTLWEMDPSELGLD